MRDEYDFSDAERRNPYAERILEHGYAIVVNCGAAQDYCIDDSGDNIQNVDSVAECNVEYHNAKVSPEFNELE